MRNCNLLILLLVFSIAPHYLNAQVVTVEKTHLNTYLFTGFPKGKVFLKNGTVQEAELNYDTENKGIIFKSNGQIMVVTNANDVDTVMIYNRKFVPVEGVFYEVLEAAAVGLYATYSNKRKPIVSSPEHDGTRKGKSDNANNSVAPAYVSRPNQLNYTVDILNHYWLKKGNSFYKANNEKQLLKVFPMKNNEAIKSYIKENSIDFNKEEDLVRLVAYCNTLLR